LSSLGENAIDAGLIIGHKKEAAGNNLPLKDR
jgi:hypothetical protein